MTPFDLGIYMYEDNIITFHCACVGEITDGDLDIFDACDQHLGILTDEDDYDQ